MSPFPPVRPRDSVVDRRLTLPPAATPRSTTVKSADLKAHKKHSFEISTPETTYLLYAGE